MSEVTEKALLTKWFPTITPEASEDSESQEKPLRDRTHVPEKRTMTAFPKTSTPMIKVISALAVVAVVVGVSLGVALGVKPKTKEPSHINEQTDRRKGISYFDASVLGEYSKCSDLEADVAEAVAIIANTTIDREARQKFHDEYFYFTNRGSGPPMMGGDMVLEDGVAMMDGVQGEAAGGAASSNKESSFGTNNQVDGVDEADLVKSDEDHVFAVYGDKLVVWDAKTLTEVSRTQIPTDDDEGVPLCDPDNGGGGIVIMDTKSGPGPCYHNNFWNAIQIKSLLLHGDRLIVVAYTGSTKKDAEPAILSDARGTRVFVYDVSNIPTDLSALPLISRKDISGNYQTARSIDRHAHIITSSFVNTYYHLERHLSAWDADFQDMNEEEYKAAALAVAAEKTPDFITKLTSELTSLYGDEACTGIAKIAIMLKAKAENGDASVGADEPKVPSFTQSSILNQFTQIHSFDLLEDFSSAQNEPSTISTSVSGVFFPTPSYTNNIYSSAEKLVIAGESYVEDDEGEWDEHTVFLVFDLEEASSTPSSVGDVPGSLLNQFSMDHYYDPSTDTDYLRVATTTWGRFGLVDGVWQQTELSESLVSVLKMSDGDSGTTSNMDVVGQVTGIGKDERVYAARFFGDRAYVVTFKRTDPFYTLDMTNPLEPKVVGELKILGYSSYLHPVGDDLVLGIGQDADENGVTLGLQISMFNVSNFADPQQVHKYTENSGSGSSALYEHKAFRYLEKSKLLILPVYMNPWRWGPIGDNEEEEFFDGFVVYDVDETKKFSKKFSIPHVEKNDAGNSMVYCWSRDNLPERSLVFDGVVTTMKGHTAKSHNLDTEESVNSLNLDDRRTAGEDACSGWRDDIVLF